MQLIKPMFRVVAVPLAFNTSLDYETVLDNIVAEDENVQHLRGAFSNLDLLLGRRRKRESNRKMQNMSVFKSHEIAERNYRYKVVGLKQKPLNNQEADDEIPTHLDLWNR